MNRRSFLATSAGGAAALAAGCMQRLGFERQSAWRDPPLVDDRPNAVYYPAVVEGMSVYDTTTTGPYTVALAYSYPHRFWQLTGSDPQKTVVEDDDSMHLMAAVWETDSKTVIPVDAGLSAEVTNDDGLVTQEVIYPMLSQKMGFHYGTNVAVEGNGTYTANVSIGGTDMARTGEFEGRFGDPATATFEFSFSTDEMYDIEFRRLNDKQGEPGAVEPTDAMPVGRAPAVESLPGTHLGTGTSGDAQVPLRVVPVDGNDAGDGGSSATTTASATGSTETDSTATNASTPANEPTPASGSTRVSASNDSDGQSGTRARIAAFPRTPHNRIVLPLMAMSATVERGDETVSEGTLARTLDPDLGYYYRAEPTRLRSGDTVEVSVGTPPQVARHDGYETALLEMDSMTFDVTGTPTD